MNKLKIKSMRIKNFKGLKSFKIDRVVDNLEIYGDNATGKTTIVDAFYWLLFNRDSTGKADFQLKPVTSDGMEKNNLDTEVETTISFDGKLIRLMRRYKEKWARQKGKPIKEFTGHTNDYFIDEVPTSKREFDKFISSILTQEGFELVTNPYKFNSIHWQERRKIILEICGDVSEEDVVNSDEKLDGLLEILGDASIDDHKKKISAKKKDINKELLEIPVRIDELSTSIEDVEKPSPGKIKELDKKILSLQTDLSKIRSNELVSEKRIRINVIDGEIQNLKNDAVGKENELKKPLHDEIRKLESDLRKLESDRDKLRDSVETEKGRCRIVESSLVQMRAEYAKIRDEEPDIINSCPVCKQNLPDGNIERAKEAFKVQKAERLEKNQTTGKEMRQALDNRVNVILEDEKSIAELLDKIERLGFRIKELKGNLDTLPITETVDTDKLDLEKESLNELIHGLLKGSKELENECKEELQPFLDELSRLQKDGLMFEASVESRDRIKELKEQERKLAEEFESLESEIFMIDQFTVRKVEMLEDKINSKFRLARFKMFNKQINGGIEECCETIFDGVPYNHGLNNAARINVGLDIISTLSEFYGFSAPVFIDNAESINNIIPMDTQLITLSVSDDKELLIK